MEIKKLHQDDLQRLMRRSAGALSPDAGVGRGRVAHRQFLDEVLENDHLQGGGVRGAARATGGKGGGGGPGLGRGWPVYRRCASS